MRFVKIVVTGLGVLVLIAGVAIAIFVSQFKPDDYRGRIAESIAKATGRDVQLRGSIGVSFGLVPVVSVADFSLGNMQGGSRPEMLKAATLEVSVALLPLIVDRRVEVKRLAVDGVDLLLERLADGRANWQMTPNEAAAPSASTATGAAPSRSLPSIDALVMTKTTITWRDAGKPARTLALEKMEAGLPRDGGLSLTATGVLDGVAIVADAKLKSLAAVLAGVEPVPGVFALKVAGGTFGVDGRFGPGAAFDGKVTAQAPATASLLALAGHQGPELGALALTAVVKVEPAGVAISDGAIALGEGPDRLSMKIAGKMSSAGAIDFGVTAESANAKLLQRLGAAVPDGAFSLRTTLSGTAPAIAAEGIDLKLGESRAQGRIGVERLAPTPKIAIDLGVDRVALAPAASAPPPGSPSAPSPATAGGGDGRVIPALPLPWEALTKADATVTLRVGSLVAGGIDLQALQLRATLVGGVATLTDLEFGFAGGHWASQGVAKGGDQSVGLTLKADAVDSAALAKAFGASPAVASKLDLAIELAGQGADLRAVLASSHGLLTLDAAGGVMSTALFKGSAGSVARILLAGRADEDVRLECAVIHLPIQQGVARVAEGVVETQKVGLSTSGTINLGNEKLSLRVDPTTRDPTLQVLAPSVLINGSMGAPEVGADRAAVAAGAIATLGALAAGKNPLSGGTVPTAAENCAAARAGKPGGSALTPASIPASGQAAPGQILPGVARPGAVAPALPDALKGLFEGLGRRR